VSDSRWRVEVIVMPKDGVSDPQGEAVKGGLGMLGHPGVARVRVGRHIVVDVDAPTSADATQSVTKMAEQLLANPVIEQFRISNVSEIEPAEVAR
jgi:phosphoribosylformylglycinamidine synthase PurS subunit